MADLTYEMILMLDPEAGDEQREKIAADVKSKLDSRGEILHEDNWGLRKMAYQIDKRESADYRFFKFSGGTDLLDDFGHSLKITDGVLRFRIFKTERDSPVMVPPDTEQIMRRDEDERGRGREGGRGSRRRFDEDSGGDRSSDRSSAEPAPAAAGCRLRVAPHRGFPGSSGFIVAGADFPGEGLPRLGRDLSNQKEHEVAASNINRVTVTGNLTRDPELRTIGSTGNSVCSLRIAVNTRRKQGDQWVDKPNYFDVTVWGAQGQNCAQYLSKGRPVAIDGRLEWREWDAKDGTKRQSVDIVADTVQFLGSRGDNGGGQQSSDQGFATTSDVPADTDFPDTDPVGAHAGGGGGDDDIPF